MGACSHNLIANIFLAQQVSHANIRGAAEEEPKFRLNPTFEKR